MLKLVANPSERPSENFMGLLKSSHRPKSTAPCRPQKAEISLLCAMGTKTPAATSSSAYALTLFTSPQGRAGSQR